MAQFKEEEIWFCRTDIFLKNSMFWIYVVQNCDTGNLAIEIDLPNLDLGTCADPEAGGCFPVTIEQIQKIPGPGMGGYKFAIVRDDVRHRFEEKVKESVRILQEAKQFVDINNLPKIEDLFANRTPDSDAKKTT